MLKHERRALHTARHKLLKLCVLTKWLNMAMSSSERDSVAANVRCDVALTCTVRLDGGSCIVTSGGVASSFFSSSLLRCIGWRWRASSAIASCAHVMFGSIGLGPAISTSVSIGEMAVVAARAQPVAGASCNADRTGASRNQVVYGQRVPAQLSEVS